MRSSHAHRARTENEQEAEMAINGPIAGDRSRKVRSFRLNLAIFLGVNLILLIIAAALLAAGYPFGGSLWPYPVLMGLWAILVAVQGYRAYH
jgi:hypothetical protein